MSHQDWEPVVWKKEAIVSKPVKEKVSIFLYHPDTKDGIIK
jgi:hypothetical protein